MKTFAFSGSIQNIKFILIAASFQLFANTPTFANIRNLEFTQLSQGNTAIEEPFSPGTHIVRSTEQEKMYLPFIPRTPETPNTVDYRTEMLIVYISETEPSAGADDARFQKIEVLPTQQYGDNNYQLLVRIQSPTLGEGCVGLPVLSRRFAVAKTVRVDNLFIVRSIIQKTPGQPCE